MVHQPHVRLTIGVLGLILLISPRIVFAEGPQMFQYGWGAAGGHLEGEIVNIGATLCVSSTPNPYPDPKIASVRAPTTGCQNGSKLSQDTPITVLDPDPRDVPVFVTGEASATATSAELTATATVSTAAEESVAVVVASAKYYQENLPSPVPPGRMLTRLLKVSGIVSGSSSNVGIQVDLVSDDPRQAVHFVQTFKTSVNQIITLPPLLIGSSGTFSIYISVGASQTDVGTTTVTVRAPCGQPAITGELSGSFNSATGWSGSYNVSERDGLELKDVLLQAFPSIPSDLQVPAPRYLAERMSVPYLKLKTTDFDSSAFIPNGHCELRPDGSSPDPDTSRASCASRLIDFKSTDDTLEATYEIDNIPQGTASCVLVTQHYQFDPPAFGKEPTTVLYANALTPLITYTYLPDDPSKSLDQTAGITVAQRFHFMVDNQTAQSATLLKANDAVKPVVIFPPINFIAGGLQIVTPPEDSACPAAPFMPPPMYDPTCHEQSWVGVAGPGQAGTVDDFHQTSDPFVLMPGLGVRPTGNGYVPTLAVGGCPACLHIHWRWPPPSLGNLPSLLLSQFNGGMPLVPSGSDQIVNVAVTRYVEGEEEHPSVDFQMLASSHEPLTSASNFGNQPVVFWYGGTGFRSTDSFFTHGLFFSAFVNTEQTLNAAVLPTSRSVSVGTAATAFATVLNSSASPATGCAVLPAAPLPATFTYQTTSPLTNQPTGTENTPFDIPAGGSRSLVLSITPTAPIAPTDVPLMFTCRDAGPANITSGLDSLLLSSSTDSTPDIVALSATQSHDGIVNIPGVAGSGAFAVATVNVGSDGLITVSADTGYTVLPVGLFVCQTTPAGQCVAPPASTTTVQVGSSDTPTFTVFVQGNGSIAVPFDPANARVFVRFNDANGVTRGSTSVAVRTQ